MLTGNLPKQLCASLIVTLALCSGMVTAEPLNGIGTYVGLVGATENGVGSSGLSLGADAQFTINDNWSLVPYLMISDERDTTSRTVADGLAGLQARRWFGDWFAGGQFFVHDRIVLSNDNALSSAYGPAIGLVAGFENANGWGAELQSDSFESTNFIGVYRNAFRVHLTYRWH